MTGSTSTWPAAYEQRFLGKAVACKNVFRWSHTGQTPGQTAPGSLRVPLNARKALMIDYIFGAASGSQNGSGPDGGTAGRCFSKPRELGWQRESVL
ncbi:MAG: hypothetical protein DMG65_13235 [Candidatus Angelobacter sp. Gp1-AA117]|nr:MAG: hypothetical protein DMG65_13235 [Candidatus Angelobacter sp. Gp1-AA117]